jgi:hypothetical protein
MPTRDDFRTKHAGPTKPLARTFGMAKSGVRMIRGKSPDKACQAMRADSVDDIARKCEELGLKPKTNRRRKPAPSPLIVRMSRLTDPRSVVRRFDFGSVPGWNVDYPHCIFIRWPRNPTHACLKSR